MKTVAFVILFAIAARSVTDVKIPSFITPCRPNDDECLSNTLEHLRPHLLVGIPDFQLPSLEPVYVGDYNITGGTPPELTYNLTITAIQFSGATNFTVSKFHVDVDPPKLDLVLVFPRITGTMIEDISALGFDLNVKAKGRVNSVLNDVVVSFSLGGTKVTNKQQLHVKWDDDLVKVSLGEVNYDLSGISEGRDSYEIFLRKVFKRPDIYKPEIESFLKNTFGKFIVHVLNVVHDIYPIDVLYLVQ